MRWRRSGELIGARFARSEPQANAVEYVKGLLSGEERKNSWTLSERAGHRVPDRMQRLPRTMFAATIQPHVGPKIKRSGTGRAMSQPATRTGFAAVAV
ncbi:UNVERIFIED_ORG: hypothetical protein ABIB19_000178 [Arthrobacter sp. UYEF10]